MDLVKCDCELCVVFVPLTGVCTGGPPSSWVRLFVYVGMLLEIKTWFVEASCEWESEALGLLL